MWNFGDGVTSTEKNPSHTYAEYKTYTVVLTVMVKDSNELKDSKSVQITIPDPDDVDNDLVVHHRPACIGKP